MAISILLLLAVAAIAWAKKKEELLTVRW